MSESDEMRGLFERASEAVKDGSQFACEGGEKVQGVLPRISLVHNDIFLMLNGQFELLDEKSRLAFACAGDLGWGEVGFSVIIEATFTDCHDVRMVEKRSEERGCSVWFVRDVARMDSYGRFELRIFFGVSDRAMGSFHGGGDLDHAIDFCFGGLREDGVQIVREAVEIEMGVRIDQHGWSPLDDGGGPGESTSEDDHEDVIPAVHAAGSRGFVERYGDSCGAGIAEAVEVDHEAVHGNVHARGDGFDDTKVGLVRDEAGDIFDGNAGEGERGLACIEHGGDGLLVGLLPVHLDGVKALGCVFGRDGDLASASWDLEDLGKSAVAAVDRGQDTA